MLSSTLGLGVSLECADLPALWSRCNCAIPRWDQSGDKSPHSKETPLSQLRVYSFWQHCTDPILVDDVFRTLSQQVYEQKVRTYPLRRLGTNFAPVIR
jgi:hypothetical protein